MEGGEIDGNYFDGSVIDQSGMEWLKWNDGRPTVSRRAGCCLCGEGREGTNAAG